MLFDLWLPLWVAERKKKNLGPIISGKKLKILFYPGFSKTFNKMKVYFIY